MKKLLQLIVLLGIISCQANEKENYLLEENQYEKFEVSCDRDTILISSKGVKISIEANTFDCKVSNIVTLNFAAILNKSDMILNGLYTMDEQGQYLESGGMVQLRDLTNHTQSFNKPVRLEIPTLVANSEISEYSSKKMGDHLVWSNPKNRIELINDENLTSGKSLFKENCASCHSTDLRKPLVAPALGNVHLFRNADWLKRFTRNSQKMIADGDSISLCLWNQYGTVMTSFELLSDLEIENIYEFIGNESRLQGIAKNEIEYVTECDFNQGHRNSNVNIANDTFAFSTNYAYVLELSNSQWVNADYLANFETTEIAPIILNLDKKYENINITMSFQERNILVPFNEDETKSLSYSLWHPLNKDYIDFPLGEIVHIVAYTKLGEFKYKIMEYEPNKDNNTIDFSLDSGDREAFMKELEKL